MTDAVVQAVEDIASTPWVYLALYAVIAAATWAVYSTALGYLGGVAFEREPLKGVALGLAFLITAAHEGARVYRHRRRGAR